MRGPVARFYLTRLASHLPVGVSTHVGQTGNRPPIFILRGLLFFPKTRRAWTSIGNAPCAVTDSWVLLMDVQFISGEEQAIGSIPCPNGIGGPVGGTVKYRRHPGQAWLGSTPGDGRLATGGL